MRAGGIAICLLLTIVTAGCHYVVLIPSELRTDSVEKVCVLLFSAVESSHLTLTIQNTEINSTVFQKELPASTGFNCFSFTIGKNAMSSHYITLLSVSVKGSGEILSINETKWVVLKTYNSLTFIQTDKPVYKPGQFVKFRILTLNDRFIPVQEEYPLVTVWDPKSNRIGQWNDVMPRQGIVDLTYELMPEPMQGLYRIEVLKKEGKVEHYFSVEQYVLPKAELKVNMPQKILMTDPVIHIEVCGRYTYGKPMRGTVNGTVCIQPYGYYYMLVRHCEKVHGKTDSNGCLLVDLPTEPFKLVQRRFTDRLQGEFSLEEDGTGLHFSAYGETGVNSEISKITFEEAEDYYKKGLPYTGQIRMQYSTGAPVVNASIFLFCSLEAGAKKLVTDENGLASFSLDTTNWGSLPVSFTAIYQGAYRFQSNLPHHNSGYHVVKPFYSRSGSFLSIHGHHQKLDCGSQLDVDVHYTITCPTVQEKASLDIFYLMMSRGIIVTLNRKSISVGGSPGSRGHFSLSFPIDAELSPVARLLVFAVLPEGEMIGDSTKFQVQKCFQNKVSLRFSVAEDLPKSQVSLDVNAAPDSLCGLRVVDRSVLLLKPEKELSKKSIYSMLPVSDLSEYHYSIQEDSNDFCRRQSPWSVPVSRDDETGDLARILQDMGLKILTDTEYHKPIECETREMVLTARNTVFDSYHPMVMHSVSSPGLPRMPEIARLVSTMRQYFPETWIWELVPVSPSGSVSLPLTVPDSITEWKGSVFCTGETGFGISETVSLNAFQPFFVELVVPFSIVRTEGFTLKAKVFNYLKKCIMVKVSLIEATGFKLISEGNVEHRSCVCAMDSVTISWQLIATGLGEQNLTVSAESVASDTLCGNEVVIVPEKGAIDIICKSLLIKAEGSEIELTRSSFLCPSGETVTEHIHLELPEDVIEGSDRAYVTVLGDIMGSAMENLDSLLTLPTGCGEQNMVKFAPNVYVQRYLNKTHQLSSEIQHKAIGYLRTGYQNQLKYKHDDGSFSAFGSRDREGNTWLTAFVLKSFLQARPYIFIDEKIIRDATTFFLTHRMESGCFASLGSLFNNAMKGGVDDSISLSAYVTTALLELENNNPKLADEIFQNWIKSELPQVPSSSRPSVSEYSAEEFSHPPTLGGPPLFKDFKTEVLDRALSCLRDALETVNSSYTLSLLAYTFTLAQEQLSRNKTLQRLEEIAIKEDGLTHWRREQEPEEEHGYWWRAPSAEVEMTAYVLLALLSQPQVPTSDLDRSIPIVRWLVKQRNSYGGFASTQDTVVALQALSIYAELTHVADSHSSVSVSSESGFHQEFHIDSSNQLLLQSRTLPELPGEYSVEVTGTGCLLLQTSLRYNRPAIPLDAAFRVSILMTNQQPSNYNLFPQSQHTLKINVTYVGKRAVSNMVLVNIAMISGFSPIKDSYQSSLDRANISRSEIKDGHFILYLYPMESHHLLQFSIEVSHDFEVEHRKPAAVKVYDYYETDDSVVVEYEAAAESGNV
uniref:A2M2 n=1 Tax=Sphyrna zygaena TaxID=195335 RepID=A0A146GEU3_SPHZY|nr:A2M2 [Sphyrna zygaena]